MKFFFVLIVFSMGFQSAKAEMFVRCVEEFEGLSMNTVAVLKPQDKSGRLYQVDISRSQMTMDHEISTEKIKISSMICDGLKMDYDLSSQRLILEKLNCWTSQVEDQQKHEEFQVTLDPKEQMYSLTHKSGREELQVGFAPVPTFECKINVTGRLAGRRPVTYDEGDRSQ